MNTMTRREILFRGWNEKNKKWLYGYYFVYRGFHFISPDEKVNPLDTYEDYVVDADTVGQYTGMKDAKGVKIFDGDIIKSRNFRYAIQYNEFETRFMAVFEERQDFQYRINQQWINEFKTVVIGNIHENPELFITK